MAVMESLRPAQLPRLLFLSLPLLSCALLVSLAAGRKPAADGYDFAAHYSKREVSIPMRDGVRLFTAIYSPRDTSRAYPFLLTRTPYSIGDYGPNRYPEMASTLEKNGFILVFQDVRGRYMSEGEFVEERPENNTPVRPNETDEATDTYDTIDWLLHNVPNHNGKAGLKGISYPGFYTSAGLIHAHPALVAASPQAPMADLFRGDDAYHNGALFLLSNFSFYTTFEPQRNPGLPPEPNAYKYGTKDGYSFYLKAGPLSNLKGNVYWTDVKEHSTFDAYWQSRNILPHLTHVNPAVLIVGGWFDAEDLSGTLKTYAAIREQSPETKVHLVMGPWWHGGWSHARGDKMGDLSFGAATGQFFREQIELPFFTHYLKGDPDPGLPEAYLFETGSNAWRKEPEWPLSRTVNKLLYLHAGRSLSFDQPSDSEAFDEYASDPQTPVPFSAKPVLETPKEYMVADQRFVDKRFDVLVYQSDVLAQGLTVAGPIRPSLYFTSTGTDCDFIVKLIDVHPDGYEQLLRGEPFRSKFRQSWEKPEPLMPGEVTHIEFAMPSVYHRFSQGHRLMVQIQSTWFPLIDRNPQTFVNIPEAKASDFVKTTERIYRSRTAATAIELPVLPEASQ